jgi:hypothetical protein
MVSRWVAVDEMVHELGSLRATIQEAEGRPDLAEADVTVELRASLARAADHIHIVIGSDDETAVARAWRSIASAQEVGRRAQAALAQDEAKRRIARLQALAAGTKAG